VLHVKLRESLKKKYDILLLQMANLLKSLEAAPPSDHMYRHMN